MNAPCSHAMHVEPDTDTQQRSEAECQAITFLVLWSRARNIPALGAWQVFISEKHPLRKAYVERSISGFN